MTLPSVDDRPPTSARWTRLLELAAQITGRKGGRSDRVERWLLGAALSIFIGIIAVSWVNLPDAPGTPVPGWALVAGGLAILTLCLNAAEFRLSGSMLGASIPFVDAVRVSVVGSAANIFPIPGAVLVRARALRQAGKRSSEAFAVTAAIGIAWVGAAAILAGLFLLTASGPGLLPSVFLLSGVVSGILVLAIVRFTGRRLTLTSGLLLTVVEFISVAVSGARLYAVGRAARFDIDLAGAVTVSLGAILSSVVGIFPGGLGIRELASGVFAELVGIPASVGVILSAFDRIVIYIVLAAAVAGLTIPYRYSSRRPGDGPRSRS